MTNQRLELTWIGKGEELQLEPRILIEDPKKSYGDISSKNMLIHGDNLLALKALEQDYTGMIKCIYIDPPYNTGSAFEHYDDGVEHSIWLSLIKPRIEILWKLLHQDYGSIWVSIDDSEMPYLRLIMDEVCGRSSFIASNIWQKRYSRENREAIGDVHEYVLVYAKSVSRFKEIRNKLPLTEKQSKVYKNRNNNPKGRWRPIPMTAQGYRPNQMYEIKSPGGAIHTPPEGRCWSMVEDRFKELEAEGKIYYGKDNNSQPNVIRFLSEVPGVVPWTWWPSEEVGHTDEAKKEMHNLYGKKNAFDTPKPERLIERIINIASDPEDIILDSFLGSGTTAAVAQKLGRRWIGIELGEHANTHCLPRLKKVVDGLDDGGITKAVDWKGGGGFKFYNLAPSLLKQDDFGNWVIDESYNPNMLAAAMAKQEGYTYGPDQERFWKQARSTENDYLYTTTQLVTVELVDRIAEQLGKDESLLICCKSFQKEAGKRDTRIDAKKIPSTLLGRCEFGRDDYSLNIVSMPTDEDRAAFEPAAQRMEREAKEAVHRKYGEQATMFAQSEEE